MECEIGSDESISTAVMRAVSAVEGRDPLSLRPLTDVLDPDALDRLFAARHDGTARRGGSLSFVYSKCRVTVENGEYLTIHPIDPRIRDDHGPEVVDKGLE